MQDWIHHPGQPPQRVFVDVLHAYPGDKPCGGLLHFLIPLLDASLSQDTERNSKILLTPPEMHLIIASLTKST